MGDEVVAQAEIVVYGAAHAFYEAHPELVVLHQVTSELVSILRGWAERYRALDPVQKHDLWMILGSLFSGRG